VIQVAYDQFVKAEHAEQVEQYTRIYSTRNPDQGRGAFRVGCKRALNAINPGKASGILQKQNWLQMSQIFLYPHSNH
jgi:hypothetical protein